MPFGAKGGDTPAKDRAIEAREKLLPPLSALEPEWRQRFLMGCALGRLAFASQRERLGGQWSAADETAEAWGIWGAFLEMGEA